MKLTAQNIVDWLEEHGYAVHSSISSTQADLSACRWLYSDSFDYGILYIEPPDPEHRESLVTIVTYSNDILRVETDRVEALFNMISAAFDHYASWERQLLSCILYQSPLQELVRIGDTVFHAPMIIDGIDGQCYGITDWYPADIHPTWKMRLENDAISYEFVTRNAGREFFRRLVNSPRAEFNPSEVWPNMTMHSNIYYRGQRCGFIVLYEYQHKMRPGDLHFLYVFARIVEQHIAQHPEKYCYATYLEYYFFSVLHRGLDDWDKLSTIFRYNRWQYQDPYRVYALLPAGGEDDAAPESAALPAELLAQRLRRACPDAVSVAWQGTLTVLVNLRGEGSEKYVQALCPPNWHAGRSLVFGDIRRFASFSRQAQETAQAAKRRGVPMLDARQILVPRLTRELAGSAYACSYIPDSLRRLSQYDAARGTALLPTLHHFIMCNLNSTDTAQVLRLHRNTILQRLEKIHKVSGLTAEEIVNKHGIPGALLFCNLLLLPENASTPSV